MASEFRGKKFQSTEPWFCAFPALTQPRQLRKCHYVSLDVNSDSPQARTAPRYSLTQVTKLKSEELMDKVLSHKLEEV